MTCGTLEDSVLACRSSLAVFHEEAVIVSLGGNKETDMLLQKLPDLSSARIVHLPVPQLPELTLNGIYGELSMEKTEWKSFIKDRIKEILRYKPEAVFADNAMFSLYPIVHALRKKHIPVLTAVEKVAIGYGTPREKWLDHMSVKEAEFYIEEGQFAPGSMLPKVEAAVAFAKSGKGRKALITLLEKAEDGIEGKTGTEIELV